jgi:hypothetical protein
MRRLLDWKVDGLITDDPDHLRDVMRESAMWRPPGIRRQRCSPCRRTVITVTPSRPQHHGP